MTVVLTGPGRGIGRATAFELARRGIPLALVGRASVRFEETLGRLRASGGQAEPFPCDLARPDEIERTARRIAETAGPLRAIVHNAAVIHRAPVEETSVADWDEQLAVNVRAPFLLTKALLPGMKRLRSGRIVCVGSISSTLGTRSAAAYCASKWALVGFMKSLAEELSDSGVTTMALLPGSVDTEMLEGSGFTPRMTPEDVARAIAYYVLEAPAAHNGGVVEMFGT